MSRNLHGNCSCGRNKYTISFPQDATSQVEVFIDGDSAPAAYLRVPLIWVQSTTYAYFENESHSSIRRAYTPQKQEHTKRHFCGLCGTPLSLWSEESREEAEFLCVTVGSLGQDGLDILEEMGLLGEGDETVTSSGLETVEVSGSEPWYEKMLSGRLTGNIKRKRGKEGRSDGTTVEWEIIEWSDDGEGMEDLIEGPLTKRMRPAEEKPKEDEEALDGVH